MSHFQNDIHDMWKSFLHCNTVLTSYMYPLQCNVQLRNILRNITNTHKTILNISDNLILPVLCCILVMKRHSQQTVIDLQCIATVINTLVIQSKLSKRWWNEWICSSATAGRLCDACYTFFWTLLQILFQIYITDGWKDGQTEFWQLRPCNM